jgi:hypothetical protein
MSGSLDLGIPNITVVVRENTDANKIALALPDVSVNIQQGNNYTVEIQPSDLAVYRTGSLPAIAISAYSASYVQTADTANTASYVQTAQSAISASYALKATTSSFATKATTSSFALHSNTSNTASYAVFALSVAASASSVYTNLSASNDMYVGNNLTVVNSAIIPSITGSITTAETASHALTASYAETTVVGWEQLQNKPTGIVSSSAQTIDNINGNVILPSSVTSSIQATTVQINSDTANIYISASSVSGIYNETRIVNPPIPTNKFSAASVEYMAQRTSDIRSGIIISSWSGSIVTYTDVSNTDIGNTEDLSFNFIKIADNMRLRVLSVGSGSGDWTINFLFKLFPNLL